MLPSYCRAVVQATTLAIVLAGPAAGQAQKPAAPPQTLADSLLAFERAWGQSYVTGDTMTVKRLLAPDWIGWLDDTESTVESELAGLRKGERILGDVVDRAKIRIFGTTAVVQARERNRVADAGGGSHWIARHITDVFLLRNGQWVVVASHDSRIPDVK